jgi:hypothetical protein
MQNRTIAFFSFSASSSGVNLPHPTLPGSLQPPLQTPHLSPPLRRSLCIGWYVGGRAVPPAGAGSTICSRRESANYLPVTTRFLKLYQECVKTVSVHVCSMRRMMGVENSPFSAKQRLLLHASLEYDRPPPSLQSGRRGNSRSCSDHYSGQRNCCSGSSRDCQLNAYTF